MIDTSQSGQQPDEPRPLHPIADDDFDDLMGGTGPAAVGVFSTEPDDDPEEAGAPGVISLGSDADGARALPQQQRSRERVERILDAAARQLSELPIAEVNTKTIASEARVSAATLYRYFTDKDAIILALTRRDLDEVATNVMTAMLSEQFATIGDAARAALRVYRDTYAAKPLFVKIYLRGRHTDSLTAYGADYNRDLATLLKQFVIDAGLARPDIPDAVALLTIEMGDRVFQTAFNDDGNYDPEIVDRGIEMLVAGLQEWATPGR